MSSKKISKKHKTNKGQEVQDEIFRKMSASEKIKLASDLSSFCLKLSQLNKNGNRKTSNKSY